MIDRVTRSLVLTLLTAALVSLPTGVALADEAPDTTAPQIGLNPCHDDETSCRRVYAEVFGDLQPGDDLAVLGARIGDEVLTEHVFDDGTGFEPYGWFRPYGNDVVFPVDYALSVEVPRGTSDITFYARDLEGNTSELTTTVLGPIPPGPVRRLTARLTGARRALVAWRTPELHGSCCVRYVVTTPGRKPRSTFSAPPSYGGGVVSYRRLSPGWHRFTVRASTEGGAGPSRAVRLLVPRRHRG
ncbi:fibronectin type III domain-containing protein [Nocardioides ferulae]|uniref:fibronectin type III domain-containing protein n=1 Tax=Nocardioides ferulae TaxID=2340821 RepID=UPI000EB30436|nr:fibronectin type III domain-containing protein [Nocardioides ferulae]